MDENSQELTLFAVDSLASPSPSRGAGELRQMSDGCGLSSPASFAWYDPATCSWKTFQGSLHEAWETYSESFPRSGTMRSGRAYRLSPLVPYTAVIGSSLLPTPSTVETSSEQGWANKNANVKKWGGANSLSAMARTGMWPTPRNCTATMAANITPNAAAKAHTRFPNLETVVALRTWPTPNASDWKGPNFSGGRSLIENGLATQVGGHLNPTWVEWLMGFPEGWTDLED